MKFSIRDILFVTAIVALAIGWALDRMRLVRQTPAAPATASDSYEIVSTGKDSDGVLLFNPRTGELWKRYTDGTWFAHAKSLAESQK